MRRILTLALLAAAAPALAGEPVRRPEVTAAPPTREAHRQRCEALRLQPVILPFTPGLRRLTELPPANLERPVNRTIDGCPVPVIVRYGVDDRPARPSSR